MAKEISTSIDIAAPASAVWAILSDFHSYSEWNPFVRLIQGDLKEGAKLKVLLDTPDRNPMSIHPMLIKVTPGREFCWRGRMWNLPGLFTGEHRFEVQPVDENSVRFVHEEHFTGIVVPFMWSRMVDDTTAGFVTMNEALKRLAEAG